MDPEIQQANMVFKMCLTLESCFKKTMRNVICCLEVHPSQHLPAQS